jgi:IS30 family transposase
VKYDAPQQEPSYSGDRSFTKIVNGLSIHTRSKNIDNLKSRGHLEGGLIYSSQYSHIATLVNRKSRFTVLKLARKDAQFIYEVLLATFRRILAGKRKYLIWDRGMELAKIR